jgi:DNA modification methylase
MSKGSKTSHFGTRARINHDSSEFYHSRLNTALPGSQPASPAADNPFPPEYANRIIPSSSERMAELPDRSLHLMITSPPYNATKEYDQDLSLDEYLAFLCRVFSETYRVLVDGGRACINIANLGRRPYIPLTAHITTMMLEIGFLMRGEIIWNKGAGAGVSMAWGSWQSASNPVLRDTHEYILIFTRGSFRRRKPRDIRSTITKEQFMEWTRSVWTFPPESARKVGHPAPFPIELPYRLIQLYSFPGDVILDPFMGSGATAIAALRSGRTYAGYETDPAYIQLAEKRIQKARAISEKSLTDTKSP